GESTARLYGMPEGKEAVEVGPLHAFFLLLDKPQAYNLPEVPRLPRKTMAERYGWSAAVGIGFAMVAALVFRGGRRWRRQITLPLRKNHPPSLAGQGRAGAL